MMSTIIVLSALLGGSIARGGSSRQRLQYTIDILQSIRTVSITEEKTELLKTQYSTEKSLFPLRSASALPSQKANKRPLKEPSLSIETLPEDYNNEYLLSEVTLLGCLNGTGTFTRVRYRFDNVFLENEDVLSIHLPPSVPLPNTSLVVDGVHGASPFVKSTTELPTAIYHRDINQKQEHYLNISYTHVQEISQKLPVLRKCTHWETRPVYLMYVPHPYNVWHVWNDALMGAYQTLREQGHLPLADIQQDGTMIEYTEGLEEECHWKIDLYGNGTAYRPSTCLPKTGLLPKLKPRKCSPAFDQWCRPGLVAYNRSSGPILLMAKGSIWPDRKWRHMFTAISEEIREWDSMVGTCFKELYVVKSHTLNFYTGIFSSYASYSHAQEQRVGAMHAFQELMATAERRNREERHEKRPRLNAWGGYNNPDLEILRKGIGPESLSALSTLRDIRTASIEEGKLDEEDIAEIQRTRNEETEDMLRFVREKQQEQEEQELRTSGSARNFTTARPPRKGAPGATAYPQFVPTPSAPRPVVTFMWRMSFKRCAVNEVDILTYILLRYNVTVRVTTFNEPLMETMDLMNSTDILLGMHGAGWTNALFLKRGAAAMQLHPYGWRNPKTKIPIRGGSYKAIIRAKEALYVEWVNPFANYSFFRPIDFLSMERKGTPIPYKYSLHPDPDVKVPYEIKGNPGAQWIYQNTLVKIRDIAVKLDKMMELKGILPVPVMGPELVQPAGALPVPV